MIARSTGAAPRQRGRSDGWTLSQVRSASSAGGISSPYAQTTTVGAPRSSPGAGRSGWSTGIPSRSATSFAGGGGEPAAAAGAARRAASGARRRRDRARAARARRRRTARSRRPRSAPWRSGEDEPGAELPSASRRDVGVRAVEHQLAVEVVDLVLHDPRRVALELERDAARPSTSCASSVTFAARSTGTRTDPSERQPSASTRCPSRRGVTTGLTSTGPRRRACRRRSGAGCRPASPRARRPRRRASAAIIRSLTCASSSSNSSTSSARIRSTGSPYWRICESAISLRTSRSASRLRLLVGQLLELVVVLVLVRRGRGRDRGRPRGEFSRRSPSITACVWQRPASTTLCVRAIVEARPTWTTIVLPARRERRSARAVTEAVRRTAARKSRLRLDRRRASRPARQVEVAASVAARRCPASDIRYSAVEHAGRGAALAAPRRRATTQLPSRPALDRPRSRAAPPAASPSRIDSASSQRRPCAVLLQRLRIDVDDGGEPVAAHRRARRPRAAPTRGARPTAAASSSRAAARGGGRAAAAPARGRGARRRRPRAAPASSRSAASGAPGSGPDDEDRDEVPERRVAERLAPLELAARGTRRRRG